MDLQPAASQPGRFADGFDFDPASGGVAPRPYQVALVSELARLATGDDARGRRLLVHVATGGGKTFIANDWLVRCVLPIGARVLWVTKSWELLRQAARDLCRRYPGARERVGRVGGGVRLAELGEDPDAQLVYTTIHTWYRRRDLDFRGARFDVVIVDEAHWGEGKRLYRALLRRFGKRACFVGLTATPRVWSRFELVGERYGFARLVDMRVLARPEAEAPRRTRVAWRPGRSATGDFTAGSLAELARSEVRNELIVDTYARGRASGRPYGKTVVFAIDVDHACELASAFRARGFPAAALHHEMSAQARAEVIELFRTREGEQRSRIDVLVNVEMLTHGVDIPDIETVFLARPTASDILLMQMVGRGARRARGKDRFAIVDFVDNLEVHGDVLVTFDRLFGRAFAAPRTGRGERKPARRREQRRRLVRHGYQPAPIHVYPGKPGYEALTGLEYQPRQTFGIELELTRPGFDGHMPHDWMEVAEALRRAVGEVASVGRRVYDEYHPDGVDHSRWNVSWDSSCGWEITSRILRGEAGFEEVVDVCAAVERAMRTLRLKVNRRTGAHVHLGWEPDVATLRNLMATVAAYEPALLSLVSPSRADSEYCTPIRRQCDRIAVFRTLADWRTHLGIEDARYHAVNLSHLFEGFGTVEIRLHNGTHEAPKILTWVSLWMRLLEAVDRGFEVPLGAGASRWRQPLAAGPYGDIAVLARRLGAGPGLIERLVARRTYVVGNSWVHHQHYGPLAARLHRRWTGR